MKSPHILLAGNPRRLKENLRDVINPAALDEIESALCENVRQLLLLARHHYTFSSARSRAHWRHRVSRAYYAAYSAARATRLFVKGDYSTDVQDHHKFAQLPDDFPNKDRFANQLAVLREDRNLSDYDHTARAKDLVLGTTETLTLVEEFLVLTEQYLRSKGLNR